MAASDVPVIDAYSGFDHKAGMTDDGRAGPDVSPAWVVDPLDKRRLNAYARAKAYQETVGRLFLPDDAVDKRRDWRELGDAAALIDRIASAVMGDEMTIAVDGADEPPTDWPELPDPPEAPGEAAEDDIAAPYRQRAYEAVVRVWEEAADAAIARWEAWAALHPKLVAREEWLRDWAIDEQFDAKVYENETENAVPLGDGVLVVGWDVTAGRPSVDLYAPDAYFPVLSDDQRGYPAKVHLAWSYLDDAGDEWLRRITYELVDLEDLGQAPRRLEYHEPTAPPATVTCVKSDGRWPIKRVNEDGLVNLSDEAAEWEVEVDPVTGDEVEVRQLDLLIDFLPVVHIPNTPTTTGHFGRSALVRVSQLLDEIADTDTDVARASRMAGLPPIYTDAIIESGRLAPGMIFHGGGEGTAGSGLSKLSMAEELAAVAEQATRLLDRLSVNGKVPAGLMGRIDASEVPSGVALLLSFAPFVQLIEAMRLARRHKYRLLLKFVQRFAVLHGRKTLPSFADDPTVYDAELRLGTYLPQDLAAAADVIVKLTNARALDIAGAVRMAQAAGADVDDVTATVAAIKSEAADLAEAIANAVGPEHAARFLGIADYETPADAVSEDAAPGSIPRLSLGGLGL